MNLKNRIKRLEGRHRTGASNEDAKKTRQQIGELVVAATTGKPLPPADPDYQPSQETLNVRQRLLDQFDQIIAQEKELASYAR